MKKYKINKTKNIGTVVFVVEGGRADTGGTELRLLKRLFSEILGYEVQELRRGCDEFIGHGSNPYSKVFALNLPKNQLTELSDEGIDELFACLRSEFDIKPEDCPIFFLYDRDYLSYKPNELRGRYVKKYTDPYSNETGEQGQLLLSYPSIESYLLSCIQEDVYKQECFLAGEAKNILKSLDFSEEKINGTDHLIHAAIEMNKGLTNLGVNQYNLDDLGPALLAVYDAQQKNFASNKKFSLLSLVSMALLELGIIYEVEDACD